MTYKQAFHLISTDLHRWNKPENSKMGGAKMLRLLLLHKGSKFMFWWRLCHVKGILTPFYRLMLRHYSEKYGIEIPVAVEIGEAFMIGHSVGIVMNGNCNIGNNVTICQFLSIGSTTGKAATIGDNAYIGPHVSLVNDVYIGKNAIIGAGAVVTKDVPDNEIWAGNPAKFIKKRE